MELVDLDQIDSDEQGVIKPRPERLATDLKQQWYASIEAEVKEQLLLREEDMRGQLQVWYTFAACVSIRFIHRRLQSPSNHR
jgi:hypothetical protein